MANIFVAATATWNGKALKKGMKEISSFEKSIRSLGRTLGVTLGAAALINYGKNAVKAFMADEKAAKSLEVQLKNTGYAFSAPGVELYIANLQKATGVLDDQLRPALQTLLTASGSLTQSQRALAVALDVSAATGKSVTEVSAAMAKGFSGQTTALTRLGAGLSKATLASGDMNKILDELSSKFSGQALARLETYAGKMDQLKVASQNVSETIGKGILDALTILGDDKSISNATSNMEKFGTAVADAILGMGVLLSKLKGLDEKTGANKLYPILGVLASASGIGALMNLGKTQRTTPTSNFTYDLGAGADTDIARAKEATAIKNAAKLRAQENAALKAKAALQGLIDKYDVERIGLMAALNAATDDETKQRLSEKLAILDGNAARASEYLAARNADQALVDLATSTDEAAKSLDKLKDWDPLSGLKVTAQDLMKTGVSASGGGGSSSGGSAINYPPATTAYDPLAGIRVTPADIASAGAFNPLSGLRATPQEIQVTIDTLSQGDEFAQLIAKSMLISQKNGYSQIPAGAL